VPLEGRFLLVALVIARITLNVVVHQLPLNNSVSIFQKLVVKTLKHFDNVFVTGGNNIVEVFESLTVNKFLNNGHTVV
jgi:precorrin-6B methylase 2